MAQASHKAEFPDTEDFDPAVVRELEPKLINLMQQSEALVALMRGFFQQLDKRRSEEFKVIAGYIAKAKEEIRELRPHNLSQERIPTAGAELEAITRDTENATHTIMNCAETIMGLDASSFGGDANAYKAAVDDQIMMIFEACSFQDITGQRVSKVVNVLKQIEDRVSRLASKLGVEDKDAELSEADKRSRDLLLNGPAIGGPETQQDSIDALFNGGFDSFDQVDVTPKAVTPEPAPKPEPAPVAKAPEAQPAPKPAPAPVVAPVAAPVAVAAEDSNSQDDIDALFDMSPEDLNKTNSQDDIDALFD